MAIALSVPTTRNDPSLNSMSAASASISAAAGGVHQRRCQRLALLDDRVGRRQQRVAADDSAARPIGAAADRNLGGVALHVADRFERHADAIVHELREHGGVALAVRMRAAKHVESSVGVETQVHALVEDAAELDVVAHRAAAQLAALLRGLLACGKALQIAELDALVQQAYELAAVVVP